MTTTTPAPRFAVLRNIAAPGWGLYVIRPGVSAHVWEPCDRHMEAPTASGLKPDPTLARFPTGRAALAALLDIYRPGALTVTRDRFHGWRAALTVGA